MHCEIDQPIVLRMDTMIHFMRKSVIGPKASKGSNQQLVLGVLAAVCTASPAMAQAQGGSPILNAVNFVQSILLGPVATAVAVIAVAMVGFMMLTGRMNWRFGATVILGCFILFGAPRIVQMIQAAG
jgi:type IV secretion system protein VirB2